MKKMMALILGVCSTSIGICNDVNWSFPPTTISTPSLNSSDAHVAIDGSGNVVSVWVENGFVKASSKPVNMNWGSIVTLSNFGASNPKVVSDASGNANAIWLENGVVKASSKTLTGNWSAATALSSMSGATAPDLSVDSSGDVLAVWARNGNLESSIKMFNNNWKPVQSIASVAAANPRVSMNGPSANVQAFVVWEGSPPAPPPGGTAGPSPVIYTATRAISKPWGAAKIISDQNHSAANAHVAVDANGNATAVWYKYDLTNTDVYSGVTVESACYSAATGIWGTIIGISEPGAYNPASLMARIAYDGTGNAIALWSTSLDGKTFNVQSAIKPYHGNWSSATDLIPSNLYSFSGDLTAFNGFGDALGVYMFYNGTQLSIKSTETSLNGFLDNLWSVPLNLSTGNQNGYPRVAGSIAGNVLNAAAVWISSNGTNTTVSASTGTLPLVLPASNPSVVQQSTNFGVFTEYANLLSWTASADPNLAGYLIFRNGVFLTQVGAGVVQFLDDNQPHLGNATYGVVAINEDNHQSVIANVNFP